MTARGRMSLQKVAPTPGTPGRIMSANEVATTKFRGLRTARWVRANAPGRLAGTREALYFESAIDRWMVALEQGRAS